MARGRMVNKKISNDKRVNDMPLQAQLLFTWLIPHLDCNGCFYGSAQMIKSLVIPRKNWSKKQIEKWLVVMENSKNSEGSPLIFRYTVNMEQYLFMPGFVGEQIGLRRDKEKAEFPTFDGKVTEKIGQTIPLIEREVEVEVEREVKEGEGNMEEIGRNNLYKILEGTRGFPKYSQENVWKLEDVMSDYPGLNYLLEFKKFKEYWNTRQIKRPWLALRNWLGKAKEQSGKAKGRGLPGPKDYEPTAEYPDL